MYKWAEEQTGNLRIIGWEARRVDDHIYVVTYGTDTGDGPKYNGVCEVNLQASLVRKITGDPELEKKYGFFK